MICHAFLKILPISLSKFGKGSSSIFRKYVYVKKNYKALNWKALVKLIKNCSHFWVCYSGTIVCEIVLTAFTILSKCFMTLATHYTILVGIIVTCASKYTAYTCYFFINVGIIWILESLNQLKTLRKLMRFFHDAHC